MLTAIGVVHHALDAIEAADAALDLVLAPGLHLLRPMGVCDVGSAEGDEILHAALELLLRLFGGTDEVGGEHGDLDLFLDGFRHIGAPAAVEGGGFQPIVIRVVGGGGDVDGVHAHSLERFCVLHARLETVAFAGLPDLVIALVHGEADDERIILAALLADALDDLLDEAQPVLEAAAVLVRALVGVGAQELLQEIAVRGVQLNAVHARLLAPDRRVDELADELLYLAVGECPDMPAGDLARLALGGAGRGKDQPLLHHLATDAGRDLVDELGEGLAHLAALGSM